MDQEPITIHTKQVRTAGISVLIAMTLAFAPTVTLAGVTAAQKCEGGKNEASGKYAACMAKAEKSLVQGGSLDRYDSAQFKCGEKHSGSWEKLEGAGSCPTTGDDSAIRGFVDACVLSVADAVGGGMLPPDVVTCNVDLTICDGDLAACEGDLSTCDGDLTACEANPAAPTLRTGQTLCHDSAGALIPCTDTGQDGELRIGIDRDFTDNGDGTITDNRTGLMWETLSDDGTIHDKDATYTWADAYATKIAGLNGDSFAGHADWRLPNRLELETLRNLGASSPATYAAFDTGCVAACTSLDCSCTDVGSYWSSTTVADNTNFAWNLDMTDGGGPDAGSSKTSALRVRGVRTGVAGTPPTVGLLETGQTISYGAGSDGAEQRGVARSYTDNGDGTISDNVTGLMWEKKSDDGSIHDKDNTYTWRTNSTPTTMNGTMVTIFLATLNGGGGFAGHTDWRIPNVTELQSLVSFAVSLPSVSSEFNSTCTGGCTVTTCSCTRSLPHWSSTTVEAFPNNAWTVNFSTGDTGYEYETLNNNVRAVRAGS